MLRCLTDCEHVCPEMMKVSELHGLFLELRFASKLGRAYML